MKLKICHLYPDVLNLYGDGGNILCLKRRLEWRGIGCEIVKAPIGDGASLAGCDLVFIGGGQDFEQSVLLDDLRRGRAREICAAVRDGVTFLAICGGFQLLGNSYQTHDGKCCDFSGALDYSTVGAKERMIGNYHFQCTPEAGGSVVVGFENHSGRTYLGAGVSPLGTVLSGHGNNGEDGTEGVHMLNVFGSYSHGPVLPKNPAFADLLLKTALERRFGSAELAPLNDEAELAAHKAMIEKLESR